MFVRRSTSEQTKLLKNFVYNEIYRINKMLFGLKQEKLAKKKFKTKLKGNGILDVIVEQKG